MKEDITLKYIHISLFFLKDPATAAQVCEALELVPGEEPKVLNSQVGLCRADPHPHPGAPAFAHVSQVLTYASEEDMMAYPKSAAHQHLLERIVPLVDHVIVAEYPIDE